MGRTTHAVVGILRQRTDAIWRVSRLLACRQRKPGHPSVPRVFAVLDRLAGVCSVCYGCYGQAADELRIQGVGYRAVDSAVREDRRANTASCALLGKLSITGQAVWHSCWMLSVRAACYTAVVSSSAGHAVRCAVLCMLSATSAPADSCVNTC
jgi:hypothetical protein